VELGEKRLLLGPEPELKKQLERGKLKMDGIQLVDDLDALVPPEARPARRRRTAK
jgi:hypothetical protein